MKFLFCQDPQFARQVDETYRLEADAIAAPGVDYVLVNFDILVNENDSVRAVKRVPPQPEPTLGIYRGWMLKPAQYAELYDALNEKNIWLVNPPAAYRHCHYLPESFSIIEPYTPQSVWLPLSGDVDMDSVMVL